ncbi:chorismate--pyruvate lyase family protein [Mycobacterium decipiens]|uniref:chorismate--pyruvate lyase family protein n=1 Tax=Mycobacterium decipiens TaxID=1430326 RepID=UPI0013FD7234|nr:chorismate pyruvate-lyase family protein [Mycobacterium decipiens]
MHSNFLTAEEIRKFGRDLRILLATNGTLPRILGILANDDIFTQIIDRDICVATPEMRSPERPFNGRTLHRKVLLKGRSSGKLFVVAESLISIDLVPPKLIDNLIEMDRPIGESILANGIEIFKENPKLWMSTLPDWLKLDERQDLAQEAIARRYRMTIRGQPAIVVTEYFPLGTFTKSITTATIGADGEDGNAEIDMSISDCSCEDAIQQQMADC